MSDNETDLVSRVGWALVTELHRDVPEDERPQSWSDLSHDQERRILCAAAQAIRMAKPPKRQFSTVIDRRHARAQGIAHVVIKAIEKFLRPYRDMERDAYRAVFDALYLEGVEVITEEDRRQAGLPPRDQNGLTDDELRLMDARLTHAMLSPMPPVGMPAPR